MSSQNDDRNINIDLGEITTVLGQRNSGKSVLLRYLMYQMQSFVNIDPLQEHYLDSAISVQTPQEFKNAIENGRVKIHIHDLECLKEDGLNKYLGLFGQLRNTFLIMDEIQKHTNANYCPESLSEIIQIHTSHNNCGLVVATRQAKFLPTELWIETNNYMIYYYGKSRDAKIKQLPVADEYKDKIHTLDPTQHEFLYITDETNKQPVVMDAVPLVE